MERSDEEELRMLLQRVSRRIRNNRSDGTMSDSKLGVLFRLEQEPWTPGRLAEHERVSPPSMNRTLNSLEESGLVARTPDPADARKVLVTITDAGIAMISETRRLRGEWLSQRLSEFTPDERDRLEAVIPLLRRLSES